MSETAFFVIPESCKCKEFHHSFLLYLQEEFAANVASIIHYNVELKKEEDEEEEAAAVSLRTEACASLHTLFVKVCVAELYFPQCFIWCNILGLVMAESLFSKGENALSCLCIVMSYPG